MSDFTLVNQGAMQAGIDALRKAKNDLNSTLETLKGQLRSSLSEWDGAAQEAYRDAENKWNQAAQRIAEIVAKMEAVLGQISSGYADNERKVQGHWAK